MRKAIERNAKHEGDLSLALKKIDIEKRLALGQLSRKQEAVKIQMFRKRETLSKQFKVQLFEQGCSWHALTQESQRHQEEVLLVEEVQVDSFLLHHFQAQV